MDRLERRFGVGQALLVGSRGSRGEEEGAGRGRRCEGGEGKVGAGDEAEDGNGRRDKGQADGVLLATEETYMDKDSWEVGTSEKFIS